MVVIAAGVMLSRAVRLIGLPDIGDPFDVAAFRALNTLPADQDADVLIRQAAAKASKRPMMVAVRQIGTTGGWSKIDAKLRQWLEANRDALSLFRQGVERPDGIVSRRVEKPEEFGDLDFAPLVLLAMLEGSRLEDQGDMEGAWSWYRTVLRMRLLAMQRGSVNQRLLVDRQCAILRKRIDSWAANPKTRVSLVRRALDDVVACEPKPEWDAYSLKIEYLSMMNELSRPGGWVQHGSGPERDYRIANVKLPDELTSRLYAARRLVRNEPEVSRRVLRLAFANWLAHDQDPDPHRRNPSAIASLEVLDRKVTVPFFVAGPKRLTVRTECRPMIWRAGFSPLVTPSGCSTIGPGGRSDCPRNARMRAWSCCWPRSSMSATTERPRLGTKTWSVRTSTACRMTAPTRSPTAGRGGCGSRRTWNLPLRAIVNDADSRERSDVSMPAPTAAGDSRFRAGLADGRGSSCGSSWSWP